MASNIGKLVLLVLFASVCLMNTSALPVKRSALPGRDGAHMKRTVLGAGSRLELNCEAKGGSPIVFHWLHNGVPISQGPLDHLSENVLAPGLSNSSAGILIQAKGQLVIQQVGEQHSGKYTCVADTGDERQAESFTVEVTSPSTKDETEPVEEELRFYQLTYNLGQTEGKAAYFTCRATQGVDKPAPVIKWSLTDSRHGNKHILETDVEKGVVIHGNGDLELSHISMDYHVMNGSLRCIAYGENGQVIKTRPEDIGVFVFERER